MTANPAPTRRFSKSDRNQHGAIAHRQSAPEAGPILELDAAADTLPEDDRDGTLIDSADIPGGGRLYLVRHGQDYEILVGDEQLMGSWDSASEEALATLVCARLAPGAGRLLIGGLGMGFTLAAALAALPADASVTVAELVPAIVGWAKGPLAHVFGGSLSDPRVTIDVRDVHDVICERQGAFDAILLDVDNGPDGLVNLANDRLYCAWGLRAAYAALRPRGTLAIWSAYPDDAFSERLRTAGFAVEQVMVPADGGEHLAPYHIWLAVRPS